MLLAPEQSFSEGGLFFVASARSRETRPLGIFLFIPSFPGADFDRLDTRENSSAYFGKGLSSREHGADV